MIPIKTLNTASLLALSWPLAIVGIALVLGTESIKGWLLAGVACGPAAVLWYTTRVSARTTSQLIQEAKR